MLFNLAQSAEFLGISPTSVKRLIEGGTLTPTPYGKADTKRPAIRFSMAQLKDYKRQANASTGNGNGNGHGAPAVDPTPAKTLTVPEGYAKVADAAQMLSWKYQRLSDQIKNGKIDCITVQGRHYVSHAEIEKAKALPVAGHAKNGTVVAATVTPSPADTVSKATFRLMQHIENIENRLKALDAVEATLARVEQRIDMLVTTFTS